MPRVKRGTIHLKKRRRILKRTKGYRWQRSSLLKQAKTAVMRAGANALRDRRSKKREFRKLWEIRINAAARQNGVSYSVLMGRLKKAGIGLDRKILAELAVKKPKVFSALIHNFSTGRT